MHACGLNMTPGDKGCLTTAVSADNTTANRAAAGIPRRSLHSNRRRDTGFPPLRSSPRASITITDSLAKLEEVVEDEIHPARADTLGALTSSRDEVVHVSHVYATNAHLPSRAAHRFQGTELYLYPRHQRASGSEGNAAAAMGPKPLNGVHLQTRVGDRASCYT